MCVDCSTALQGPADVAVEEVHSILRQIVARTIESDECKGLAQFSLLKREIATTSATSLEGMREEARKMVQTMVEMESSYLTAEVFKEILQQSGSADGHELLMRTLSGRPVSNLQSQQLFMHILFLSAKATAGIAFNNVIANSQASSTYPVLQKIHA